MMEEFNPIKFPGWYSPDKSKTGFRLQLCTKSLITQVPHFEGEQYIREGNDIFRIIDPERSKIAAAITNQISQLGIRPGQTMLYLGAAHGYTPSYISDVLGPEGKMFALDHAPQVVRHLVGLCHLRPNMTPIIGDAAMPDTYQHCITAVDYIFQDIAQKHQVEAFLRNVNAFLVSGGFGAIAVKARSIDVTQKPTAIFNQVRKKLEAHTTVVDQRNLDPFEKDHAMFIIKKK